MRQCVHNGWLVGPQYWLPEQPFDYDWGRIHPIIGCNRLRCGNCGEVVSATLSSSGVAREYSCSCQKHAESSFHPLDGSDQGLLHELVTKWHCDGHPELTIPARIDGVDVPNDPSAFGALVDRGLTSPPFVPPDTDGSAFWVTRLYWLLPPSKRGALSQAVADRFEATDPNLVRAAIDFFLDVRDAPGAERLAVVARKNAVLLAATPDPGKPSVTLWKRLLQAIQNRLNLKDGDGNVADVAALEVARDALLRGDNAEALVYQLARSDLAWLCEHAGEVVRAAPDISDDLAFAVRDAPPGLRSAALKAIGRP